MTTPATFYQTLKHLPEPLLNEVMAFVESLHSKNQAKATENVDLLAFKGGLENSITFAGDAVTFQKEWRDDFR